MFGVVALILIAILTLGIIIFVNNKPTADPSSPSTTATPTADAKQPLSTYTPTPTATMTPSPTFTPAPKGIVCLDPGHQKTTDQNKEPVGPGAEEQVAKMASVGADNKELNLLEYEWNLKVSEIIKTELERRGYTVYLTRSDNETSISNKERAELANAKKADILVGIQVDAYSGSSEVSGVYAQIADTDNPYAGARAAKNKKLATLLQDAVVDATGAKTRSLQNGNNKLALLNYANMPACVMQLGYLSNPEEARLLASDDYQNKIAVAICDGIDSYFKGNDQ